MTFKNEDLVRIAQMEHDAAMETARLTLARAAKRIICLQPDDRIPELELLARSLKDASVFVGEVKELDFG